MAPGCGALPAPDCSSQPCMNGGTCSTLPHGGRRQTPFIAIDKSPYSPIHSLYRTYWSQTSCYPIYIILYIIHLFLLQVTSVNAVTGSWGLTVRWQLAPVPPTPVYMEEPVCWTTRTFTASVEDSTQDHGNIEQLPIVN